MAASAAVTAPAPAALAFRTLLITTTTEGRKFEMGDSVVVETVVAAVGIVVAWLGAWLFSRSARTDAANAIERADKANEIAERALAINEREARAREVMWSFEQVSPLVYRLTNTGTATACGVLVHTPRESRRLNKVDKHRDDLSPGEAIDLLIPAKPEDAETPGNAVITWTRDQTERQEWIYPLND